MEATEESQTCCPYHAAGGRDGVCSGDAGEGARERCAEGRAIVMEQNAYDRGEYDAVLTVRTNGLGAAVRDAARMGWPGSGCSQNYARGFCDELLWLASLKEQSNETALLRAERVIYRDAHLPMSKWVR